MAKTPKWLVRSNARRAAEAAAIQSPKSALDDFVGALEMFARKAGEYAASPAQIRYLAKLASDRGDEAEHLIQSGMLSKRQACLMISQYVGG
jgi:hypothetical protein